MTRVQYVKKQEQKNLEKELIIEKLKNKVPELNGANRNIKLPEYIFFTIKDDCLSIQIHEFKATDDGVPFNPTCENMQTDNAAFEGWAICLKAWLDNIKKITLSWDIPEEKCKNLHYNRFMYRVLRFLEAYQEWFSVDDKNNNEIMKFEGEFKNVKNNAYSKTPEQKKKKFKFGETEMEFLMANDYDSQIKSKYCLKFVDRQFPVGLKKQGKQFFTGGMSAIDLWGLNSDNSKLTVIELKYGSKNIKVGIISELFLYSCVMRDIIIGLIKDQEETRNCNEKTFYNNARRVSAINARMLATHYHPLIENDNVFNILNTNAFQQNIPINFQRNYYSYDFDSKELKFIQ